MYTVVGQCRVPSPGEEVQATVVLSGCMGKFRLSIKIILFPVDRRVAKKGTTGDFFFHFFSKNGQYFHGKKKWKKKKLQLPDWLQF